MIGGGSGSVKSQTSVTRGSAKRLVNLVACNVALSLGPGDASLKLVRRVALNAGMLGQLVAFFWSNKRWWLVPMLVTLCLFVALIALAQSSAIAPFVYTLF